MVRFWVRVTVFNTTFNNISAISWQSVLLVDERKSLTNFYHIMLYWVHLATSGIRAHNFSGNRHWLHRYLYIQLPYDHDHDGPLTTDNIPFNIQMAISDITLHFTASSQISNFKMWPDVTRYWISIIDRQIKIN